MGHGTCKAAKSARHLIESKEKNRSSRVKVFSTHINLSHPAASWLATQTCATNIFNLFQNNNAIYLFENDNKIEQVFLNIQKQVCDEKPSENWRDLDLYIKNSFADGVIDEYKTRFLKHIRKCLK